MLLFQLRHPATANLMLRACETNATSGGNSFGNMPLFSSYISSLDLFENFQKNNILVWLLVFLFMCCFHVSNCHHDFPALLPCHFFDLFGASQKDPPSRYPRPWWVLAGTSEAQKEGFWEYIFLAPRLAKDRLNANGMPESTARASGASTCSSSQPRSGTLPQATQPGWGGASHGCGINDAQNYPRAWPDL